MWDRSSTNASRARWLGWQGEPEAGVRVGSASGRVRRSDWPHGPKFYAYAGRAYVGAYDSLEAAIAAVESTSHETPTSRRERIVSRAVHVLTVGLSPEVRRRLLDDEDDPIPEFFARFGVVPYASEAGSHLRYEQEDDPERGARGRREGAFE